MYYKKNTPKTIIKIRANLPVGKQLNTTIRFYMGQYG